MFANSNRFKEGEEVNKYLDKQALLKWLDQRCKENNEEFEVDRSGEDMEIINEIKSGRFDVDELEILVSCIKLFSDYLREIADLSWKVHQKIRLFSEDEFKKLIADLRMTRGGH